MKSNLKSGMILTILIWFVLLIKVVSTPAAQVQKCITTGTANISERNVASAKTQAVKSALEKAVKSVASSFITSDTTPSKVDQFYSTILNKKEDFLVSYKVLGEIDNNEDLVVDVESMVDLDKLKKELFRSGIIEELQDSNLILLLVSEQRIGDILPKYWWGNYPGIYESVADARIRKEMAGRQFQIMPYAGKYFNPRIYGVNFLTIYDEQAAMTLAKSIGADLVVLGKVRVKEISKSIASELICDASIDVDIYDPIKGVKIFSDSFKAEVNQDIDDKKEFQAIDNASGYASTQLIDFCQQFFIQGVNKKINFDLIIQGENFLSRFLALKAKIMAMPGVTELQPMEMEASKAILGVGYQGSMQKFVNQLINNPFNEFAVEVIDLGDRTMYIRFVESSLP